MLGDQIASFNLVFSLKRRHDPKGVLNAHYKQNHIKGGYVHEEIPDDSIYEGVNTFSEVLANDKNKEEQIHILQHQQELKARTLSYRAMELALLEKVKKDKEEIQAHQKKFY